jgi:hypothetical protein
MVRIHSPFAPTTTLTAVAAPRNAPGMKLRAGILACTTMKSAASPTSTESTPSPPPNCCDRVMARKAHSTPLKFDATVLTRPWVLPPAAKKQPQATIPAQTGSAPGPTAT